MKKNNQPDVLALISDNKKQTKAELAAIAKERAKEKKLVWKALNYSFHVYAKRGKVMESIEMSEMLKKYFDGFEDVNEEFKGMIMPKYPKKIKK
jgi:hypothetical protein